MKIWRALAIVAVAVGCATNPATGRRQLMLMSEQEEIQTGREADAQVRQEMGVYNDPALQRYVADIGGRLVTQAHRPNLPWTFTVVDEPAVNAFAIPGGFIYLTRGILPFLRNEAELAGVLGHEIGHVDARHSAQAYSKQLGAGLGLAIAGIFSPTAEAVGNVAGAGLQLLFLKYGREAEVEADRLGVGYAGASGWDPGGVPAMLGTLARLEEASGSRRGVPNWTLTHPPAEDRVARVASAVTEAPTGGAQLRAAEFERYLDGLVFGDSREKGIVRGSDFLHPILRIALRFPAGWEVSNSQDQVTAQADEQGSAVMILQAVPGTGPLEQLGPAAMAAAGWRQTSGQRTSINGLDAYSGTYEAVSGNTNIVRAAQVAHLRVGNQVYVVAGVTTATSFAGQRATFTQTIQTFRGMTQAEADRVQPNRIDFRAVRPGETWDSLSRSAGGTIKPSTLAIMNGSEPSVPPRVGAHIRIVVGD